MKISVIIPIYNTAKYIKRCVDSIIKQLPDNAELIFINDCSTDNSVEVLKNCLNNYRGKNIQIIQNQVNLGSGETRNRGIKAARGEYVIFVDSDDYVAPQYFEILLQATNVQPDIIVFDYTELRNSGTTLKRVDIPSTPDECVEYLLLNKMHNSLCNKLFKKSLFTHNDISIPEGMSMFEDKSICFKLFFYAKSISYINKCLYFYDRKRTDSLTNKHRDSDIDASIRVVKIINDFFKDRQPPHSIINAIHANKMHVLGFIGLYCEKSVAYNYAIELGKLPAYTFLIKAKVPLHFKLASFFVNYRLSIFLNLIRKLYIWCK